MKRHRVPDGLPLLAEILRESGYHTYAEPTMPLMPQLALTRGFDEYKVRRGEDYPFVGKWGDEFIRRFEHGELKAPWFMYLHLWEPHQPRYALPRFNHQEYGETLYDRAISGVDARLGELLGAVGDHTLVAVTGDHGEKIPELKLEARIEQAKNSTKEILSRLLPYRVRSRIIDRITRIWYRAIRTLRRLGLIKSTMTTLTGHGYHVFDSLVRVPLVIAGPGVPNIDQIVSEQVRQVDILPTILDLVDLSAQIPPGLDGRSVVPLMHGHKLEPLPAFIESWISDGEPSPYYGVRTERWKYVYDPGHPERDAALYDLAVDPDELTDVAANFPDIAAEMREMAHRHFDGRHSGEVTSTGLSSQEQDELAEHLRGLGYLG
jgi:arylsulfatase A-like enzyme